MLGNSNPSINSPALPRTQNNESPTLIGEDTAFATRLFKEFNDQQTCHILVSSTNSLVQYVPHSPTPSIQEVTSPPLLCIHIAADSVSHHPPISPGLAKTILHIEVSNNFNDTTCAVAYGLISTVCQQMAVTDKEAHRGTPPY